MKKELLVLCPENLELGLVSQAAEMAESAGRRVRALVFGCQNSAFQAAEKAFACGADEVELLCLKPGFADDYALAHWLAQKIRKDWDPETVLAPATIRLRSVMPILAGILDAGLTADCTQLKMEEDGKLIQIRPAFGNNLIAKIRTTVGRQMATVRPGIYPEKKFEKSLQPVREHEVEKEARVWQTAFYPFEKAYPLHQADIIIAGGLGIGSRENFEILARAAKKTGAGLGASRMAVDAGFAPYSCQIGQTGVTVRPRVYLAVGISGAVQHLAGMLGSGTIIAVNQDPKAPIFNYADYGIIGDWKETIEKLIALL